MALEVDGKLYPDIYDSERLRDKDIRTSLYNALTCLETYIKEHGQETGTVSWQMAEQAIKDIKRILYNSCPGCGKFLFYSVGSGWYCQNCNYGAPWRTK